METLAVCMWLLRLLHPTPSHTLYSIFHCCSALLFQCLNWFHLLVEHLHCYTLSNNTQPVSHIAEQVSSHRDKQTHQAMDRYYQCHCSMSDFVYMKHHTDNCQWSNGLPCSRLKIPLPHTLQCVLHMQFLRPLGCCKSAVGCACTGLSHARSHCIEGLLWWEQGMLASSRKH